MVREACCRDRYVRYMSGGCWAALWTMRRIQMSAGSHHERRRLGSAATVRDVVQIHAGGIAQGWGSSGNSHVVDLEGAEMDGDKAVELEHLGCEVPLLGWATNADIDMQRCSLDAN